MTQPADQAAQDMVTDGWIKSPISGGNCYWSIWGNGQPCGDLASAEWRVELTRILTHWATNNGVDGFMLDAPPYYLASSSGELDNLHNALVGGYIRTSIVEPMHELGVAVFGEMYNLQRPAVAKMLDGGRNTDYPSGENTVGFPGAVHSMVMSGDASGLEAILATSVDVWARWCGTARTQPDSALPSGLNSYGMLVGAQKAAVTALLAGYYVVRFGPDCKTPYNFTPPSTSPGNEWPGGCFGEWAATQAVAATLKALPMVPALHPGTPRYQLSVHTTTSTGQLTPGGYAALRCSFSSSGDLSAAVVVLNFAVEESTVAIEINGTGIILAQEPTDLINKQRAAPAVEGTTWKVRLPAHGWAAYSVRLKGPCDMHQQQVE